MRSCLMMQNFVNLLRVIFMLSTIVVVTDCCSSRILLLKEHTLKIVHEHQLRFEGIDPNDVMQQAMAEQDYNENGSGNSNGNVNNNNNSDTNDSPKFFDRMESIIQSTLLQMLNVTESTPHIELEPIGIFNATAAIVVPPDKMDTNSTGEPVGGGSTESSLSSESPPPTTITAFSNHNNQSQHHIMDYYYTMMRDLLSFECSGEYLTDFCLNRGRCFRYPVGNHSFFSCECADGYVGERCESKSLNELYVPTPLLGVKKPKILMARIVFSFPMLIALSVLYIVCGAIIFFKCPNQNRAAGMLEVAS